ncbi:hypothetical protein [Thermococcus sp.]
MKPENKFSLMVYGWGALSGVVSGIVSLQNQAGWIIGFLLLFMIPYVAKIVLKDIPEELQDPRTAIRHSLGGFFLFWLYFTLLVYTISTGFQPKFYSNQSLLYRILNNVSATG